MTIRSTQSLEYIPAFDGLRAFAVSMVLLFHAGWKIDGIRIGQGGFIGVDVFFVLSGFLITRVLLRQVAQEGKIDFKKFYINRLLRLFPALLVVSTVFGFITLVFLSHPVFHSTLYEIFYSLTYTSNWVKAYHLHLMPFFGHTWSLSIEEQYYLIWPIILYCIQTKIPTVRIQLLIVSICIVTIFMHKYTLYYSESTPARLYNGLDTRLDSLLFGSLLGMSYNKLIRIFESVRNCYSNVFFTIQILCVAILFIACFAFSQHDNYLLSITYHSVLISSGVLIISFCVKNGGIISRIMASQPLVQVGILSYGIYLWHLPIFRLMGHINIFNRFQILILGTSIAIISAGLSYYLVERYFLRFKR